MSSKVAIIGAGTSGLPSIKSCLESGLQPICYEGTGEVGGLWNYVEEDGVDRGFVFKGVISNTSRDMTAYSDFLHPTDHPLYLPHTILAKYFKMYASHFNLMKHIKFYHKVLKVEKTENHETTGQWKVTVLDLKNDKQSESVFDFVIVASGHHIFPFLPTIRGQEIFKGEQLHSCQYRKPEKFENKTVVVMGLGNSGCDIAVECGLICKQVILSTRKKGGWIIPRAGTNGYPGDLYCCSRLTMWYQSLLPLSWVNDRIENTLNKHWDHELYGLKPKHRFLNQFPVVNDRLPIELIAGRVKIQGGVEKFTENGIKFEDNEFETPVDVIIYATGFRHKYPFLDNVIDVEDKISTFYKQVFPVELSKNTLAFVGLVDANITSTLSVAEMQSRWVAKLFTGKIMLPEVSVMERDNQGTVDYLNFAFGKGHRYHIFINSGVYTDQLASEIGAKPNFFKMFFRDPSLFWACMTGPFHNSQFRLIGPESWNGARNCIVNYEDRINLYKNRNNSSKRVAGLKKSRCNKGKKYFGAFALSVLTVYLIGKYFHVELLTHARLLKFKLQK